MVVSDAATIGDCEELLLICGTRLRGGDTEIQHRNGCCDGLFEYVMAFWTALYLTGSNESSRSYSYGDVMERANDVAEEDALDGNFLARHHHDCYFHRPRRSGYRPACSSA